MPTASPEGRWPTAHRWTRRTTTPRAGLCRWARPAKVTNLETGKSAVVTIQDRGPYVEGRIVDLSPSTAREIGLTRKEGVADVIVEPIAVPLPDGSVKAGVAAAANRDE